MSLSLYQVGFANPAPSSASGGGSTPTLTVATFGDLPAGVLYQQILVTDNGFGETAFVLFDGTNWVVTESVVPLTANLPADGVWNLSPSVVSETSTIILSTESASFWNWDGAAWVEYAIPITPTYSVATFSLLPSNALVNQRVAVTGEAGLSGLVCINTAANTWEIETVTCAYSVYSAIEWSATPSVWYNSGGITVSITNNSTLFDTTNNLSLVWNSTNSVFVPSNVFAGTIAGVKKIKGDSTTPTDWVKVETVGSGTAVISTSGGVLSLTTTQPAVSGAATASLTLTDASLSSAGNVYLKVMARVTTLTGNNCRAGLAIADGTDSYDFGSSRSLNAATATGQFYNPTTSNSAYTAQSGAQLNLSSAMVLFEMQKTATRCMARVAGGIWVDVTGAGVRDSAFKTITVTSVCNTNGSGTAAATLDIQHLAYMRF